MSNFNVITSSSLQRLVNCMATDLLAVKGFPLTTETVVVQSTGMARWVAIELAKINGISANIDFPFPNEHLANIFTKLLPETGTSSSFSTDIMTWRIMALLPKMLAKPEFEQLKNYCSGRSDGRATLQLARSIADTFDQYTIFRPDALLAWDRGEGDGWQPILWRGVSEGFHGEHRAAQLKRFKEKLENSALLQGLLPERFNLFGISYLPPFHLEAISLLARTVKIRFYLLNPCGEYWGDIISNKRQADLLLRPELPIDADEYFETGNPLLSSLGTLGQEFFSMLIDSGAEIIDIDENIESEKELQLLSMIQDDILHLRDRSNPTTEKGVISRDDNSVQVHSCHSAMREMEVLYDNLLQMFEELPGLEPRDIIVMTPDIESYSPYISAVFGTATENRPKIPYTIADRSQKHENIAIETFTQILSLPLCRFGINSVLEILGSPHVMKRFSIGAEELEDLRLWLHESNVRWGVDSEYRKSLGFPGFEENSWQSALDRMLLGYAMAAKDNWLFMGISPFANIEGKRINAVGKLACFIEKIREKVLPLRGAYTLAGWSLIFRELAETFLTAVDSSDTTLKVLYEAFSKLAAMQEESRFDGLLSRETIYDQLATMLDKQGAAYGFLGGRLTFCAMLPMRSIPFRVVCLTGMNDGVFPRVKRPPGFSLLAGKRRRGDRSLRDEDRYLFLEAVMSAKERLYISYTGKSVRDDRVLPPSVAVNELLDYAKSGFISISDNNSQSEPKLIREQKLQNFSRAYFTDDAKTGLFSYAGNICKALDLRRINGFKEVLFLDEKLPEPDGDWREVRLDDLIRFFSNPAAYFLLKRFSIRPHSATGETEEREHFTLNPLEAFKLKQEIVKVQLDNIQSDLIYEAARSASKLPPLKAGQDAFESLRREAESFSRKILEESRTALEPLEFSITIANFKLSGKLQDICKEKLLRYRAAKMKAKDKLSIWLEHLVLSAIKADAYPTRTLLICNDSSLELDFQDDAEEILLELLNIYAEGLRQPLPFFPETSLGFVEKGVEEAKKRWYGDYHTKVKPESSDSSFALCFRRSEPFGDKFEQLATMIYKPQLCLSKR